MKTMAIMCGAALILAGCSRTDNEPGPGGVTRSEAKALDDAAEMLDSRDSAGAANETSTGKGKVD